jgi:hypothetical protein
MFGLTLKEKLQFRTFSYLEEYTIKKVCFNPQLITDQKFILTDFYKMDGNYDSSIDFGHTQTMEFVYKTNYDITLSFRKFFIDTERLYKDALHGNFDTYNDLIHEKTGYLCPLDFGSKFDKSKNYEFIKIGYQIRDNAFYINEYTKRDLDLDKNILEIVYCPKELRNYEEFNIERKDISNKIVDTLVESSNHILKKTLEYNRNK